MTNAMKGVEEIRETSYKITIKIEQRELIEMLWMT